MATCILSGSRIAASAILLKSLNGALILPDTVWIYEVQVNPLTPRVELPNGPFPTHGCVWIANEYQGEILLWLKDGRLSAFEYAWITDEIPLRWPHPDELVIATDD